ncbi:hypothetical protein ACT7DH_14690 [Bacillus pacificus]
MKLNVIAFFGAGGEVLEQFMHQAVSSGAIMVVTSEMNGTLVFACCSEVNTHTLKEHKIITVPVLALNAFIDSSCLKSIG